MISGRVALSRRFRPSQAVATEMSLAGQTSLETMDRALAARDISGAEIAWRTAYGAAIRSRHWEALLAVGEGSLRLGDHGLRKRPYRVRARELWRDALFRARQRRSVDGVLRVAEAFGTRGDTAVVTQALRIADSLAADDASGDARRRVLAARARLLPPSARATAQVDPLLVLFPDAAGGHERRHRRQRAMTASSELALFVDVGVTLAPPILPVIPAPDNDLLHATDGPLSIASETAVAR